MTLLHDAFRFPVPTTRAAFIMKSFEHVPKYIGSLGECMRALQCGRPPKVGQGTRVGLADDSGADGPNTWGKAAQSMPETHRIYLHQLPDVVILQ